MVLRFVFLFFLQSVCSSAQLWSSEFNNFAGIVDRHYQSRRQGLQSNARIADPCRDQTGRFGSTPNSASKAISTIQTTANLIQDNIGECEPEAARELCSQALRHSTNWNLNSQICGVALAHYRERRKSSSLGRASTGSAWDELYGDLEETMTENEILEGLNLWGGISMGLVIDNTGSMSDDIDQVTSVIENFVDTDTFTEDMIYNFVVMSFGDPDYEEPTSYLGADQTMKHVDENVVASMGGDCPEMTCTALEQIISYTEFGTNSPIFLFTDASSKDCDDVIVDTVEDIAISHEDSINFVLTGICGDDVDGNFTRLASNTGGSIYRVDESQIYDLRNVIAGWTESSSYLGYEESDFYYDDYESYTWSRKRRSAEEGEEEEDHMPIMRRRKRQGGYTSAAFYVDETVGRLTIQVTFENIADTRLLEAVTLSSENSDCDSQVTTSRFGNMVHYAIDCPCVSLWTTRIPYSISNKWNFAARTFGEYSIGFDVLFEQVSASGYSEKIKEPCAGERTTIWVTLFQDHSIDDSGGIYMTLTGKSYEQQYKLLKDSDTGHWRTRLVVPSVNFRVAVRGRTVEGNVFLRLLNNQIRPTTTCLTTERIRPSPMTIKVGGQASIVMSLKAKDQPKQYNLYCINDRRHDGFITSISRPSSRFYNVMEVNRYYYIYITVKAPPLVGVGEVVNVKCYARSGSDKAFKSYALMVTNVYS